ncbi:type VII secretion target [Amycolatopsis sp. DG1A-15b]|uniref:type VII secretion target n=1 Tax=Amycolatopsis sp. DG1A-15b TaxID=3052846 RepID=UPI00255BA5D4|nr:type VII secretion target [Amycolatopsis sp. DG1A-15b]WIX85700.1 type VII secretion target [Amycolatopsis sp. DG1A-15b]
MTAGGYEVLADELEGQAKKAEAFADRLRAAVDAARQVTMNNDAYGVICQPFAMLLQPFEEMGVNALAKGVESISDTALGVRDALKIYTEREKAVVQRMDGIR